MEKQREFVVAQFAGLNGKLDEIKTEMSRCTKDVAKLCTDYSDLRKRVDKTANTIKSNKAKLADLEDRNQRDNVLILGIPEGMEGPNASQFISTNLLKWLPNLGEQWLEIMQVYRVGPPATGNRSPWKLICKMLRFTDRDKILQAS